MLHCQMHVERRILKGRLNDLLLVTCLLLLGSGLGAGAGYIVSDFEFRFSNLGRGCLVG